MGFYFDLHMDDWKTTYSFTSQIWLFFLPCGASSWAIYSRYSTIYSGSCVLHGIIWRMWHESHSFVILIAAVVYSVNTLSQLIYYLKTHNEPREIDLLIQKYLQSSEQNAPPAYIIEGNFFNHYGYFSSIQNRIRSENALDYLM